MPNPFAYGPKITIPQRFVGRKAELRRIFTTLDTAHTGQLQSVSIVGPRRMGRSSLLYHLYQTFPQRLADPQKYIFAYMDLESGQYARLDALLKGILACLLDGLPPNTEKLRKKLDKATKDKNFTLGEFEACIQAFQTLPEAPLYPVLCLDEFEQLTQHPDEFPDLLYDSFRSLMNGSHLALATASTRPIHEYADSTKLTSPFFNIFSEFVSLDELLPDEAQELIAWGKTCDRPFSEDDCRRALKVAGCPPLKIQLAGSLVYTAKAEPEISWRAVKRRYATLQDVEIAFETVLETGSGYFNELWTSKDTDDEQRAVLRLLSGPENPAISESELTRQAKLTSPAALRKLSWRGVIAKTDGGYRLTAPLLGRWIRKRAI